MADRANFDVGIAFLHWTVEAARGVTDPAIVAGRDGTADWLAGKLSPGSFRPSNVSGRRVPNGSPGSDPKIQTLDPTPKPAMHGRKRCARARHRLRRYPGLGWGPVEPVPSLFGASQ